MELAIWIGILFGLLFIFTFWVPVIPILILAWLSKWIDPFELFNPRSKP